MAFDVYVNYLIFFQDEAEYNFALSLADANGFYQKAPRDAATDFGIPYPYPSGDLADIPKGILFYPPQAPGEEIMFPNSTGLFYDDTVDSVLVNGQAGNPPEIWPASVNGDANFIWCGIIGRRGGTPSGGPTSFTPIPNRRWAVGFENSLLDHQGDIDRLFNRLSSRTVDGFGFPIREGDNFAISMTISDLITPADAWKSWERFYFKFSSLPVATFYFWMGRFTASPSTNQAKIALNTDGTLSVVNMAASVNNVLFTTTSPLTANTWYKLDQLIEANSAAAGGQGRWRVYLNGIPLTDQTPSNGMGAPSPANGHIESRIGAVVAGDTAIQMDFDDWTNTELPVSLNNIDFLAGTHIIPTYVTDLGPLNSGGWTPLSAPGMMNAAKTGLAAVLVTADNMTTTTPGAILNGTTDFLDEQILAGKQIFGAIAITVGSRLINADLANGTMGYVINGVATSVAQTDTIAAPQRVMRTPCQGLTLPIPVAPLGVIRTKSANADSTVINGLRAWVELAGVFGQEDVVGGVASPIPLVLHNAPYSNTYFAIQGPTFNAPMKSTGGTYTGTATQVVITSTHPINFLWVRNVTTAVVTWYWISTSIGGHKNTGVNQFDTGPSVCKYNSDTGLFEVRIAGTDNIFNASGSTYQYIAFCDPGMRYSLAGAMMNDTVASQFVYSLFNPDFTPDGVFMSREALGAANASNLYFRVPAMTASDASPLDATPVANIGSTATGFITSGTAFSAFAASKAYINWRCNDGSGVMVQICQYTGNGTNPRNITLTPTSGRAPFFAIVKARSSTAAVFRDPSHAGTGSSNYNGTANTLGIQAGAIDQITVNSGLNTNGVVYDVFVLPGGLTAWTNGDYYPPNGPSDGFPTPVPPEEGLTVIMEGGLTLGSDDVAILALTNMSGLYRVVPHRRTDEIHSGSTVTETAIPDITAKSGYIGG